MRRPRRQTVQATVTADRPIDEVSSATPEWGTPGRPRRLYGGERVTDDWVSVTKVELPLATGEFADGSSTFTLPSCTAIAGAATSTPRVISASLSVRLASWPLTAEAVYSSLVWFLEA